LSRAAFGSQLRDHFAKHKNGRGMVEYLDVVVRLDGVDSGEAV